MPKHCQGILYDPAQQEILIFDFEVLQKANCAGDTKWLLENRQLGIMARGEHYSNGYIRIAKHSTYKSLRDGQPPNVARVRAAQLVGFYI